MELKLPVTKYTNGVGSELQQVHRSVNIQLYIKHLTPSQRAFVLYLTYEGMEITYRVEGSKCHYRITGRNQVADFINDQPACVSPEPGLPYLLKFSTLARVLYSTAFHKTFGDTVVLIDVLDNTEGKRLDTLWVTHYTPSGSSVAYYTNEDGWYTEKRNDKSIPVDLNGMTYDMVINKVCNEDWEFLFDSPEYAQYVEIEEVEEHAS